MQKILIVFFLLFFTSTTVHAQDTQRKKEKDAKIAQLTQDAKLTDLIESPDGKWIAFVKKSNYTVRVLPVNECDMRCYS